MSVDALDAALALRAGGLLGEFNRAGVLTAADVHVAARLARLGGETDEAVTLAAALAARAPRLGHVRVDLATVAATAAGDVEEDVDIAALPWPDPAGWAARVAAGPLAAAADDAVAPLRLDGTFVYLDRYWRDEAAVAADLTARAGADAPVDEAVLAAGLARLSSGSAEQAVAAAAAVLGRLTVIAGGPGTGKTTTVARIAALIEEQAAAAGGYPPLIALAAPTGKAAARLTEAVRSQAAGLDVQPEVRDRLGRLAASTIHRLLRRHPGNASRFRHDRLNRLPHDVVIVDETSMVPLALMARLVEAVRADARLVLVGDPEQLASVEAGAVLGDIAGPALAAPRIRAGAAARLTRLTGVGVPAAPASGPAIGDRIATLTTNHRFTGAQARLAGAVHAGDADRAVAALAEGDPALQWLALDPTTAEPADLGYVRDAAVAAGARLVAAARSGGAEAAVAELGRFRVLCAHRRGPAGVTGWTARVEDWLADGVDGFVPEGEWYAGRPVIVTANDYSLRLFNGDTGVVVARPDGGLDVAIGAARGVVTVAPARLADIDSVYAMTIHKAQGSEFDAAVVVLPGPESRILTRELLYTGLTRARDRLVVVGTEEAVRAAIARPVARSSGLGERLWGRDR